MVLVTQGRVSFFIIFNVTFLTGSYSLQPNTTLEEAVPEDGLITPRNLGIKESVILAFKDHRLSKTALIRVSLPILQTNSLFPNVYLFLGSLVYE